MESINILYDSVFFTMQCRQITSREDANDHKKMKRTMSHFCSHIYENCGNFE